MHLKVCILAVVAATVASATQLFSECEALFAKFKVDYRMSYPNGDEAERRSIFCDNMKRADSLNDLNGSPAFGVSKFADRSEKEFSVLLGRKGHARGVDPKAAVKAPSGLQTQYVNWVERKAVTPVKNQGQCGSW